MVPNGMRLWKWVYKNRNLPYRKYFHLKSEVCLLKKDFSYCTLRLVRETFERGTEE